MNHVVSFLKNIMMLMVGQKKLMPRQMPGHAQSGYAFEYKHTSS